MPEAPVLMVDNDEAVVEQSLVAGLLACPGCGAVLGPWGHARSRLLRCSGPDQWLRPRRARCRTCRKTHVLVAEASLIRRRDEAAVIGRAVKAKATGAGHRHIAEALSLPASTVRGWLRRFTKGAEAIRSHFTRWAHALDPSLGPIHATGESLSDALEAIGVAVRAAVLRLGPRPEWSIASALSGGALLCHTSWPFPPVP
jgi:transposase-like protein